MSDRRLAFALADLATGDGGGISPAPSAQSAIAAQTGRADHRPPVPVMSGGGTQIVGPLVETAYGDRSYWTDKPGLTTDGLFSCRAPATIKFRDANNVDVVMEFKEPAFTAWNAPLGAVWGDPWHGLCQGGVLTLPNGQTRAHEQPIGMDVLLVRRPGMPAVSRSAAEQTADTAAGRQWRNYALLSGTSPRLVYNKFVYGGPWWLYIAPDGTRWKVTWSLSGAGTVSGSVTLRKFGAFGEADQSQTITLTPVTTGVPFGSVYFLDARSDGARACFGVGQSIVMAAILEISLSGSWGSLAATLTVARNYATCRTAQQVVNTTVVDSFQRLRALWADTGWPNPSIPTLDLDRSGCIDGVETWTVRGDLDTISDSKYLLAEKFTGVTIGATYGDDDALVFVTCDVGWEQSDEGPSTYSNSASGVMTDVYTPDCSGSLTGRSGVLNYDTMITRLGVRLTCYCRLYIGGQLSDCYYEAKNIGGAVVHRALEQTESLSGWSNNVTDTVQSSGTYKFFFDAVVEAGTGAPIVGGSDLTIGSAFADAGAVGVTLTSLEFRPVRVTNKLYGVRCIRASGGIRWMGALTAAFPVGDIPHDLGSAQYSDFRASVQPVTRALAVSTTADLAWV